MVTGRPVGAGFRLLGLAVILLATFGASSDPDLRAAELSEYQVKAAYLYYFATFVEWPAGTLDHGSEGLVIGVLGEDPFGEILDDTLRGKSIGGRPVVVRRFTSPQEARESQILFISASEEDRLSAVLKTLDGAHVLTVGDLNRFASRGGTVAFRTEENKVRFDINVDAVERARVKISAQLMKLGRILHDTGHP
ncbi:MAG TPA: YfiR family protein [Candidatus Polarisedimenticolia bacterium]